MKINDKILRLVKHGLKATNLTKLNESQINTLYTRLVEQVTKVQGKTQYMIGSQGGNIPPNTKGYDIKQNNDKTVTAIPIDETEEINEKSVSKQQQKLMGLALSVKKGDTPKSKVSKSVKDMAKKMSKSDLEDFASTKHKGLPNKVETNEEEKYDLGDAFEKHAANYLTKVAQKSVPRIGEIGESQLEKEITRIVEKHLSPKMTKKDFMNIIENNLIVARESEMNEESEDEMGLPSWLRWENITKK
jgi:hypothetical protein